MKAIMTDVLTDPVTHTYTGHRRDKLVKGSTFPFYGRRYAWLNSYTQLNAHILRAHAGRNYLAAPAQHHYWNTFKAPRV